MTWNRSDKRDPGCKNLSNPACRDCKNSAIILVQCVPLHIFWNKPSYYDYCFYICVRHQLSWWGWLKWLYSIHYFYYMCTFRILHTFVSTLIYVFTANFHKWHFRFQADSNIMVFVTLLYQIRASMSMPFSFCSHILPVKMNHVNILILSQIYLIF